MTHKMRIYQSGADEYHGDITDRALFQGAVMTTYLKAQQTGTQRQARFIAIARRRRELRNGDLLQRR